MEVWPTSVPWWTQHMFIAGDIYVDAEVTDMRNSDRELTIEINQRIRGTHQVVERLLLEGMVTMGLSDDEDFNSTGILEGEEMSRSRRKRGISLGPLWKKNSHHFMKL